jgi:aspartate-semialdehyde dehydrogenase
MNKLNVALLGATGAVGEELLKLMEERNFPVKTLKLLASERSQGKQVKFRNKFLTVQKAETCSFKNIDLVFSSASGAVSKFLLPYAVKEGAVCIDNTSAFRMNTEIPLIVPEVNGSEIREENRIIANPNCNSIIIAAVLGPLEKQIGIKRLFISTYQAASGAGKKAMEELVEETAAGIKGKSYSRTVIPYPYAFNCFIHNTDLNENGYVEEELKVINELRKILDKPSLKINVNCIRIPVLRAHGEVVNAEFERFTSREEIYDILKYAPGVKVFADWNNNRWPTPLDAAGINDVLAGRIRKDISKENAFDIWLVGDQIRKGAALNAIQIAEKWMTLKSRHAVLG